MRLFIALSLDQRTREQCEAAIAQLRPEAPEIRWVRQAQLHVTLAFLGEQPEPKIAGLAAQLDTIARNFAEPVHLTLQGVGAFPTLRRPRVVWLGVTSNPFLARVAGSIRAVCEPRPDRRLHPHVTLGRVRSPLSAAAARRLEAAAHAVTMQIQTSISSVDLTASILDREAARHRIVHAASWGEARSEGL